MTNGAPPDEGTSESGAPVPLSAPPAESRPDPDEGRYPIRISRRLPRILAYVVLGLVLAHLGLHIYSIRIHEVPYEIVGLFNLDEEQSVPTWYSSFALFVASMLLLAIWGRRRRERDQDAPRWLLLAVGFAVLSFDEVASLHEMWNTFSEADWTLPGAIVASLAAIYFLGFLRRLPARTRWFFLLAGAVFLGGAIGVERITVEFWYRIRESPLAYPLIDAAEEGMEMLGVVIFIQGLVDYMDSAAPGRSTDGTDPVAVTLEVDRAGR